MALSFFDLISRQTAANNDDDMTMSVTAISEQSGSCDALLAEPSGELAMSLASRVTSVFADLPDEDAISKAGRFLDMSWHVIVQLLTLQTLKACFNIFLLNYLSFLPRFKP